MKLVLLSAFFVDYAAGFGLRVIGGESRLDDLVSGNKFGPDQMPIKGAQMLTLHLSIRQALYRNAMLRRDRANARCPLLDGRRRNADCARQRGLPLEDSAGADDWRERFLCHKNHYKALPCINQAALPYDPLFCLN
jgi:hypothetical protein